MIEHRFLDHLAHAERQPRASPEMLPSRLAASCWEVLPIAAAGISLFSGGAVRVPVGASHDVAVYAERLQFTTGEGPCLEAHATDRVVVADQTDLARQWPAYYDSLVRHTPYRGVVAFPLSLPGERWGTIDLYFHRDGDPHALPMDDAASVVELVRSSMLAAVGSSDRWLDTPAATGRRTTMIAIGMLSVELELSTAEALDVLRARAFAGDATLDALAHDIVRDRIPAGRPDVDD